MSTFVVKLLQRSQLSHSQIDVKPFIYVRSKWMDDDVELDFLLTCDNQNYRSSLKYDELRNGASELEQPYDAFFAECKNALTTHMGLRGFDYEICLEDAEKPAFKVYKCEGYETLYLDVPLRKVSNCYQLLDAAIEAGQQKPQAAPDSESEAQITTSLAEYEKYVRESKLKEQELLKKFLLLLNSKKAHIRELESQLEKKGSSGKNNQRTSSDEEDEAYGAATQAMNVDDDNDSD
ncbi:uncharacterized protein LOC6545817 [Drosophila erecta]|uniref:XRCC4 N-terminal domain-containing protein n=1 Tax=Drosophila erecta TaxID=7220 RepID=B3NCG6_DROER|nr:uncharacterized protein LOC6545817 [Drosophila erecta]EDV51196.2 uncharacterized protein Dere_GG14037 [Drosophila erecta]